MDELDADDHPLQSSTGQYASRDMYVLFLLSSPSLSHSYYRVQFVPFSRFQQNIARLTKVKAL